MFLMSMLFCACSSEEEVWNELSMPDPSQYINLTISVSNGTQSVTRTPLGGENGDGRETGYERENTVSGVTVVLYEAAEGINAPDATPISFVDYYPVSLISRQAQGTTQPDKMPAEAEYTTGDRLIPANAALDFSKTYHVILIANADLSVTFGAGTTLGMVRNYTFTKLYDGTGIGTAATNFVMTSESDATIDFSVVDEVVKSSSSRISYYYRKDGFKIERLAARVDFDVTGSTYKAGRGYEYSAGDGDVFAVEGVTLFNLYNESEYLIKRQKDGATTSYLADEVATTSYVLDPRTNDKTSASLSYLSPIAATLPATYAFTATALSSISGTNKLLGYAMENTLLADSPLKAYATGIAINVAYYHKGASTPFLKKVLYGFLRHNGEGTSSYPTYEWSGINDALKGAAGTPMNFGVVRNNIYRVSLVPSFGKIKLKIAVHDWREVTHPAVYL